MNKEMSVFNFNECGVCSSWEPYVKCDATGKTLRLNITKCENDEKNTYKLDSTGLEEGCIIIEEPIEKSKAEMEKYLSENFTLIGSLDCVPFVNNRNICPTCNNSLEPGLQEC